MAPNIYHRCPVSRGAQSVCSLMPEPKRTFAQHVLTGLATSISKCGLRRPSGRDPSHAPRCTPMSMSLRRPPLPPAQEAGQRHTRAKDRQEPPTKEQRGSFETLTVIVGGPSTVGGYSNTDRLSRKTALGSRRRLVRSGRIRVNMPREAVIRRRYIRGKLTWSP